MQHEERKRDAFQTEKWRESRQHTLSSPSSMDADSHLASVRERLQAMAAMAEVSAMQNALALNIKSSMERIEQIQKSVDEDPASWSAVSLDEDDEVAAWRRKIEALSGPVTSGPASSRLTLADDSPRPVLLPPAKASTEPTEVSDAARWVDRARELFAEPEPGVEEEDRSPAARWAAHASELFPESSSVLQVRAADEDATCSAKRPALYRRCLCCFNRSPGYSSMAVDEPEEDHAVGGKHAVAVESSTFKI
jgi:hypothetical protein